ncbi:hypothetical protein B0H10DRAFT_2115262 [Mycena sp. CBHHK59/15]|nr:hypothetical protein B0H10DRAFT_2158325 [Mycena sp. CBHHK59/15]KAJ6563450.1 hypothetical protein B0H10DRAFT_2115262 [Mycena sp. CBHHK59/15]
MKALQGHQGPPMCHLWLGIPLALLLRPSGTLSPALLDPQDLLSLLLACGLLLTCRTLQSLHPPYPSLLTSHTCTVSHSVAACGLDPLYILCIH